MSVQLERMDASQLRAALPIPGRDANKYTRGKLTVVGGSEDYPGSVCLASKAALFAGAGYVECACSAVAVPLVRAFAPSLAVRACEQLSVSELGLDAVDSHHPQACAVGSGMFADGGFQDMLVGALIRDCGPALLLDGGALRIVADRGLVASIRARHDAGRVTVLTPHGGEAAALARAATVSIPATNAAHEQFAAYARELADAYGAYVLLKGPVSFIARPMGHTVYLMDQGTAALAKAGTGDVLAGIVGALLAQSVEPDVACVLGACVHAEAGRLAAQDRGIISVTAEDVLEAVPRAICSL